jgi:hydroxymethylpyrimidine/phosphomethylpyrimidine kinase
MEMQEVKACIEKAVKLFESCTACSHILPEVGTNIAMALSKAGNLEQVAALTGRIIRVEDHAVGVGEPKFGTTRYLGTVPLKAMEFNPNYRAVINIKYSRTIISICEALGMEVKTYSWDTKPEEAIDFGCTIPFIIEQIGRVPEIVYDLGDMGIEASVTIFGSDALNVAQKAVCIAEKI